MDELVRLDGVSTNRDFLLRILTHPDFIANRIDTGFVAAHLPALVASEADPVAAARPAAQVDDARLAAAAQDGKNWLATGRTYDEQRFSPLASIDAANVGRLRRIDFRHLRRHAQEDATLVENDRREVERNAVRLE